jgi:hypothetical protein
MRVKRNYLLAFLFFLLITSADGYSQEAKPQINASDYGASSSLSFGVAGHDVVSAFMMGPGLSLLHSKADYNFNLFGDKTRLLTSLYCMIQYNLYFNNKK